MAWPWSDPTPRRSQREARARRLRDGYATATAGRCVICDNEITGRADKQWCSTKCRQRAWRQAKAAPVAPTVAPRADTVYACPSCDTRYLGQQRCDDCNTWCVRLGPGSLCPCCAEPVSITDLLGPDQLAQTVPVKATLRR